MVVNESLSARLYGGADPQDRCRSLFRDRERGRPSDVLFAEASLAGWQEWAGDGIAEVLSRAVWEAESAR